jgi:hypothetical protein
MIQNSLPTVYAEGEYAEWEVMLFNYTNRNAYNVWIGFSSNENLTITEVYNIDNGLFIKGNNIYIIDSINAQRYVRLKIKAVHKSCNIESVIMYCGWCVCSTISLGDDKCSNTINVRLKSVLFITIFSD